MNEQFSLTAGLGKVKSTSMRSESNLSVVKTCELDGEGTLSVLCMHM